MRVQQVDVSVEIEEDGACVVKLQRGDLEVNLRGIAVDFDQLSDLESTDWERRRSIRAGRCLGSRAWWTSDRRAVSLLLGTDDENWDVAVELPLGVGDLIVRETRSVLVDY